MKPRSRPAEPTPPPPDAEQVRRLVRELLAAHRRGEPVHGQPALNEVSDLCGCMAGYYVQGAIGHPAGPRPLAEMVAHVMRLAPAGLESEVRMRRRWAEHDAAWRRRGRK